jgi:alpha-glucosidase
MPVEGKLDSTFLWWRDGVIYQIYPRSFADSNGDGIGDLPGITAHLDYLSQLGVDALWLSPVNPSPDIDFGYDVSDYRDIDPKFGSLADFDDLVAQAHRRGIRIILDLVLNHTSDQHPWFQAARQSPDNSYRDFYLWRDPRPGGQPPNNWVSRFGGPGWELDPASGQMYFHMFYKEQPDLNWRNPQVRQAMLDVFRFWLERGVDGFRLDVFNAYYKDAQLADNPTRLIGLRAFDRQEHTRDIDQPEMLPLLREIRTLLDSYPDRYVVGETFLDTPGKAARYVGDDRLHAAFNFQMQACAWWAPFFNDAIHAWQHALPAEAWPTWVLNNHDAPRSSSRYHTGEDDSRLKAAAALLLTLRGTPFLYYGEEIGMRNIALSRDQIRDPIGRRYWPVYRGRDGCRAPMQWNDAPNGGFSVPQVTPWLPLHPDGKQRNVAAQEADPDSLLNFYKHLIALRKSSPALRGGLFAPITYGTRFLLAYLRQTEDEMVLVALNFSRRPQRLVLGRQLEGVQWELLLSSQRRELVGIHAGLLPLQPHEAILLRAC